jgi:putative endopeptidase
MKRRIVALLTACTMLVSTGCSATVAMDENGKVTVDGVPIEELADEFDDILNNVDLSTVLSENAVNASENDEEAVYTGGKPWLNTCIKENVSEDMDTSPKDDFYFYVNRDWACNTEIKEGRSDWSSLDEVADITLGKSLAILKDDTITGHDAELAQGYFNAFLDWNTRNEEGIEPVMDTVKHITDIKNMEELSAFILDSEDNWGVPAFVEFGNMPDLNDAQKYITNIGHCNFLLGDSAEYANRTSNGDRYYKARFKMAESLLTRLGYSEQEAQEMFDQAIELEGMYASLCLTSAEENLPSYFDRINNIYEADKLDELSPVFPLGDLLKSRGFGAAEQVCIYEPEAIKKLSEIYTEDNLEAIRSYMLVGYLLKCIRILDSEAYDAYCEAQNMFSGSDGRLSDEETAYSFMMTRFYVPMNRLYVSVYDESELKDRITEICEQTIDVYREMLEEEDWLTEETRKKAIEKLDNMTINAVYPDEWEDYSRLDLNGLSYYECCKASEQYMDMLDNERTGKEVDKKKWVIDYNGTNTLAANAGYNLYDNSINIFLGILDAPFYYDGMSDEELLGGIGSVIGHEISHAFDPSGARFDKDGNTADWWTEADMAAFNERADKLINYYNNIVIWDGFQPDGRMLQGEAVADMAGVKAMLKIAESKDDFDYDRFFTSYAKIWRNISTPETQYMRVMQDPHPLNYLRGNVTLQQFDKFNETYDIKEGDNMYLAPEDRILVW